MVTAKNLVDKIIDYEGGDLTDKGTLDLFGYLVKTGKVWSLQGCYGRTATALIEDGWLDKQGNITKEIF